MTNTEGLKPMTTPELDPATATPVEIDTRLADLYLKEQSAEQRLKEAVVHLHRALGERQTHHHRGPSTWPTTDGEAIETVRAKAAAGERMSMMYSSRPFTEPLDRYDTAVAALAAVRAQAAPLNAEFRRRGGWPRFFTAQSHDGHVHSSMDCSTCNHRGRLTQFVWNPALSGMTEAETINHLGDYANSLCTVCFPDAPLERTVGRTRNHCEGGRPASTRRYGRTLYGPCPTCGENHPVTMAGEVRKHPPKTDK